MYLVFKYIVYLYTFQLRIYYLVFKYNKCIQYPTLSMTTLICKVYANKNLSTVSINVTAYLAIFIT